MKGNQHVPVNTKTGVKMKVGQFFDGILHERELGQSIKYIESYFSDNEIKGKAILDAGCGTGIDCFVFGNKGASQSCRN